MRQGSYNTDTFATLRTLWPLYQPIFALVQWKMKNDHGFTVTATFPYAPHRFGPRKSAI